MINLSSACPKPASRLECWMGLYLSNKPAKLPLKIANMMAINTQLSPGARGQYSKILH